MKDIFIMIGENIYYVFKNPIVEKMNVSTGADQLIKVDISFWAEKAAIELLQPDDKNNLTDEISKIIKRKFDLS